MERKVCSRNRLQTSLATRKDRLLTLDLLPRTNNAFFEPDLRCYITAHLAAWGRFCCCWMKQLVSAVYIRHVGYANNPPRHSGVRT